MRAVTKVLLSLHVLASLVAIGPVTVAASMFPKALRRAHDHAHGQSVLDTLQLLHRICRVYSGIGIAVPLFGFATASSLGVLGSGWLIASITLTAAAAALLALRILPAQEAALAAATAAPSWPEAPSRLRPRSAPPPTPSGSGPAHTRASTTPSAYLKNKAAYQRYDTALTEGFPIATGIIEGACRHLVKDRLDITGARWGLSGAEAVLKLHALRSNSDFDTYWAWHET